MNVYDICDCAHCRQSLLSHHCLAHSAFSTHTVCSPPGHKWSQILQHYPLAILIGLISCSTSRTSIYQPCLHCTKTSIMTLTTSRICFCPAHFYRNVCDLLHQQNHPPCGDLLHMILNCVTSSFRLNFLPFLLYHNSVVEHSHAKRVCAYPLACTFPHLQFSFSIQYSQ